jgi:hypothetical protein
MSVCSADPDNRRTGFQPPLPRGCVSSSNLRPGRQSFTTMRDDTGLRFTEIYDSADALWSAVEYIEEVALTKRSDDAPLHVRSLTPCGNTGQDFTKTPIETFHGDEAYVAVSYTSNPLTLEKCRNIVSGTRRSQTVTQDRLDACLSSSIGPCVMRRPKDMHTSGSIKNASIKLILQTASDISRSCIVSTGLVP